MTISPPSLHAKHHSSAGSVTVAFSVRSAIMIAGAENQKYVKVTNSVYLYWIFYLFARDLERRYIFDKKKTINYYMVEGKENWQVVFPFGPMHVFHWRICKKKKKFAPIGLDCRHRNIKNNIIFRFRVDFIFLWLKFKKLVLLNM